MTHQILLAAAFLAMILAPCLTAINSGYEGLDVFDDEEESC